MLIVIDDIVLSFDIVNVTCHNKTWHVDKTKNLQKNLNEILKK